MQPTTKRRLVTLAAVCTATAGYLLFTTAVFPEPGRVEGKSAPLPHPSTFLPDRLPEFQKILTGFLERNDYRNLGWAEDKGLRDTGPFINNKSYGVHPTVKIYYSPEIMTWLTGGREGTIPDGAMIVKEQYAAPAARYQLASNPPISGFIDWTIMIKDSKGSKDGWYWAEIWKGQTIDNNKPPFAVPSAGFGLYCTRCHTSAEKEFTFVSLANIKGFPGQPLTYFTDQSWAPQATPTPTPQQGVGHLGKPFGQVGPTPPEVRVGRPPPRSHHEEMALLGPADKPVETRPSPTPNPAFVRFYNSIRPVPLAEVKKIPAETYDHIVPDRKGPQQFLTSDSCMGCHSAIYYGNLMVYTGQTQSDGATPVMNVSPYGEWRWSPMGLAGRDPIFYSQLDSELAYLKTLKDKAEGEKLAREVVNTCFRCHGVMGKRQFDLDHGGSADFDREFVYQTEMKDPNFKYGALARDGVSCTACHHIVDDKPPPGVSSLKYFLDHSITGQFQTGKPDELAGPFEDNVIVTDPMNNVLGAKPRYDPFIKTSRMCGSCHTIDLPVVDQKPVGHNLEQLTYLEWLNSSYQNEFGQQNAKAQTCQDCHMRTSYSNSAGTLKVPLIQQPFASVEDDNYPAAEHRAPADKIQVRFRDSGFVRHQFQGLNVPLLEMFSQFMTEITPKSGLPSNEVLGVRQNDYMLTVNADLPNAIDAFVEQAQNSTASIAVTPVRVENGKLIANVTVTNKTGHRFPSGVGFRRAFIEFQAIDNRNNKVVWASGRTNELGIIVDEKDQPLHSEFFDRYQDESGKSQQHYQPHYYDQAGHTITRQDQVQIFEELIQDGDGNFTTSFIRRDTPVKDNRLLPLGWTEKGPDPSLSGFFLEATHPHAVGEDSHYRDSSGTSVVTYEIPLNGIDPASLTLTATIYHQSIPPYYLKMRFDQAPDYPATKRLYYLTSNLNTSGTPLENWKLKIVSSSSPATTAAR